MTEMQLYNFSCLKTNDNHIQPNNVGKCMWEVEGEEKNSIN